MATFDATNAPVDEEAAKKFRQLTSSESVKNTAMWVGSHTCEAHTTHVLNDTCRAFELRSLTYPSSIIQVYAEQIANLLDQRNEHPQDTTMFRFTFNVATGEASVMNNGKSMPVVRVRDSAGAPVWCPQMLCSGFLSSSNHDKSSGAQRTTLGAHGIGLKAMTSMSTAMRVECVDLERGLYYSQDILKCNTVINPPTILVIDKKNKPPPEMKTGGTRFTYMLDYSFYKSLPSDIFKTMDQIFKARTYQVAGYSGVATYYNDEKIPIKTPKALAEMYFPGVSFFELQHPEWNIGVGFAHINHELKGEEKAERISIINGGFIPKGVHFKHVIDKLVIDLKPKVEKFLKGKVKWDRKLVKNNISIVIIGTLPDLKFEEQIKNDLNMLDHNEYFKKFKWPPTYADKAWAIIRDALGERFVMAKAKGGASTRKLENPDKYTAALKLKTPESDLLAFEGDSAQSSAITAMAERLPQFNRESKGIILLGGCPVNARKHMTETKIGDTIYSKPDKMLMNNTVWNDFMTIMNLQYDKKYNTPEALKTLNYRHYTNVTDKDMHGMGKIGAIMIGNISQFWPELLSIGGFLGYLDSTLIRVFPKDPRKSKVLEFGSQDEFNIWQLATFPDGRVSSAWHDPKWYKGMAGHNDEECIHMFKNYNQLRMAYTDDQKAALLRLAGYFGRDVELRKDLLRLPVEPIPFVPNRKTIEVRDYCDYFVREEQQYNMICKLNSVYDGFIFNHRKIAFGAMMYKDSADRNAPIKVYQLGGYIALKCAYHHGDASLNGSIVWMSQDFVGARNIPHLMPLSQMGTRFSPDDDGAPRYVDTQCNPIVDALYPPDDRELYNYLIEDGKETSPKFMVPVVCMPILETNSLPGTGWAISKLARDYNDQVTNIHRMLDGLMPIKMRAWTPGWRGDIIEINGVEWAVGKCSYNAATNWVTISELPYQTKTKTYINGKKKKASDADDESSRKTVCLRERPLVKAETIVDYSSKTQIDIRFQLHDGAMEKIMSAHGTEQIDPLTDYLGLKEYFGAMLNFINHDGTVISFASYEAAMVPWFKERLRLYPVRFERRIIIIDLTIEMLRSQIRYMSERSAMKISGQKKTRQIEILSEAKYAMFNVARLKNPGVKNDRIRATVHGDGASYTYLLNTTDLDSSLEGIDKLGGEITMLEAERDELKAPDIVKRIWKREIAEVSKHIENARVNGWVPKGKYKYEL
jgi:DNA topoisomerase-2